MGASTAIAANGKNQGMYVYSQYVSTSSNPASSAAVSAASWSGDLCRGTTAAASAPATSATSSTRWTMCRSGSPRAWYWRQSQTENGDDRPACHQIERSQNARSSCSGLGSSSTTENATRVAATNPATKRPDGRRSGYVSQSGATTSEANFVQPESAPATPRATGDDASQKP